MRAEVPLSRKCGRFGEYPIKCSTIVKVAKCFSFSQNPQRNAKETKTVETIAIVSHNYYRVALVSRVFPAPSLHRIIPEREGGRGRINWYTQTA